MIWSLIGKEGTTLGLSVDNELFAIRLLELARLREPEGNRVRFVRACETHGIRGFLQKHQEVWTRITDDPPREGVETDRSFGIRNAGFSLKVAAFQDRVLSALDEAGIKALGIKGVSLSMLLYEDLAGREFGDADVLVATEDAQKAFRVCQELGLRAAYPMGLSPVQQAAHFRYGKAQNFRGSDLAQSLDLHWRPLSPWLGHGLLEFEQLWQTSQRLEREGLKPWRTLGNSATVAFMALHACQDGWPKMKGLLDLCVAVDKLDFSWDEVLHLASFRRPLVERAVELCVWLLGISHPGQMTHHFKDYQHAFDYWVTQSIADDTPQRKLLRPELWSCQSSVAITKAFWALLNPSVEDIQSVSLPNQLVSLYPLVRAFRLVTKAISRSRSTG